MIKQKKMRLNRELRVIIFHWRIIRPFVGNAVEGRDDVVLGKTAFISGLESNSGHCGGGGMLGWTDERT